MGNTQDWIATLPPVARDDVQTGIGIGVHLWLEKVCFEEMFANL